MRNLGGSPAGLEKLYKSSKFGDFENKSVGSQNRGYFESAEGYLEKI